MSKRKLDSLIKKYTEIFRLGEPNWDRIQVKLASSEDIGGEFVLGCCSWFPEEKYAEILILDPESSDLASTLYDAQDISREQTIESTLVHEMLHLLLEGHTGKSNRYSPSYEYGLNLLSKVLVSGSKKIINRRSRKDPKTKVASKARS